MHLWETITMKLVIALLLGGLLGVEREYRDKTAGLRTLTLICLGSCLFMQVSLLLTTGTTDRIASTIVTGIGFIGAGVIFKSEKGVNGITTAATIWATAAVGMAVGGGFYLAAVISSFLILVVLNGFMKIEHWIGKVNKERMYTVIGTLEPGLFEKYEQLLTSCHLKWIEEKRVRHGDEIHCIWRVHGSRSNQEKFVNLMIADQAIKSFDY